MRNPVPLRLSLSLAKVCRQLGDQCAPFDTWFMSVSGFSAQNKPIFTWKQKAVSHNSLVAEGGCVRSSSDHFPTPTDLPGTLGLLENWEKKTLKWNHIITQVSVQWEGREWRNSRVCKESEPDRVKTSSCKVSAHRAGIHVSLGLMSNFRMSSNPWSVCSKYSTSLDYRYFGFNLWKGWSWGRKYKKLVHHRK